MINTNAFINLESKLQNSRVNLKNDVSKSGNKVKEGFKEYFNQEVKNNSSKELTLNNVKSKDSNASQEPLVSKNSNSDENTLTKLSNKLNEISEKEDFPGNDSDVDSLSEILVLLSNLLNKNISDENLSNINIEDENLIGINLEELSSKDVEEVFLTLFNGQEEVKSNNPLIDIKFLDIDNKNNSADLKALLKEAKTLTDSILENIKSKNLDETSVDSYKKELANKILSLIDLLPKESIEKISSNIGDEDKTKIITSLLSVKNYENEDGINSKLPEVKSDTNKTPIIAKVESQLNNESSYDENLNSNDTSKKYNVDENSDEDKILSKIIDGDNKSSFSKVLNSYDKFNKINIETIKEPVAVNKQTLDLDIIKNVKFMMKNAMQELKVKVYPKELGEMTIKILSEEGIMRAEIKATSKETYNLLNSNLQDIKKSLSEQNIRIQEVNIGIYNEDTTFFSGKENSSEDFKNGQESTSSGKVIFTEEDEIKEDLLNESNVNLLA
ncbi:flagellar hook-length control protein FliK [Clostridium sp. CTA-7]